MVDPERDALEPAAEPGIGILVSSKTSDVARCLRSGAALELTNRPQQAVVDRQILRRLGAQEALCLPLMANGEPLGVLVLRREDTDEPDSDVLGPAYATELAYWLGRCALQRQDDSQALERFRELEQQRLRELVHEANNPLSIVHNYLHILELRLQHEASAVEQLQLIGSELKRAGDIFQRARDVPATSALPAAEPPMTTATLDLNEFARRLVELHRGYAAEHDVSLRHEVDAQALQLEVDGDRLAQVVTNLLRNAIEAAAHGDVTLATVPGVFRAGREGVEASVRDTGPGLPRQVLETLGAPQESAKGGEHQGVGLQVVVRLVNEMGGAVDVRSSAGHGTIISVFLPLEG